MARPAHTLVTFSGVLGAVATPAEQWSFGVRFDEDRFAADMPASVTAAATAYDSLKTLFSSLVICTKIRIASVDATGHVKQTAGGSYVQSDWLGNKPGTGAQTNFFPPQCAVVVSLGSARSGPTGKGRIFLPQTIHPIDASDFRLTSTSATAIATASKAFLNALAGITPASFPGSTKGAVVASTKGYLSPVLDVRVGRAVDSLRSRRRDIPEGYVSATL